MESKQVYEKVMMEYYLNKIKHLRNLWVGNQNYEKIGISSLIDVEGQDQRQYKSIMERCNEYIYEMLAQVVVELLSAYEIPVQYYDLRCSTAYSYYAGEDRHFIDYFDQHDEKNVLAFSRKDQKQEVLFVFKKYGILNNIPSKTIDGLLKAVKLEKYCYFSYVEKDAFSERIDHNDNENDPTRGTGLFSLKQFFSIFFGEEEYLQFRKYADEFTKKVSEYFGFKLIRTIKPNTLHNFRKNMRDDLINLNTQISELLSDLSEKQRQIIDEHFFVQKNYEVLLGDSDFAQSYMTAEWLYASLSNVGNVDLTPIAMGYFKAIEQILFRYITLHTNEKDSVIREIYAGKNDPYADKRGYAPLTDALVNDNNRKKSLTLSSLTGFFGYNNDRAKIHIQRNYDLLNPGIDEETYKFIINTFDGIVGLRNEYFHKENLSKWKKVESARNSAHVVFYLLLGAYNISAANKQELGLINVDEHDDFYQLCDYINQKAYDVSKHTRPIFYFGDVSNPNDFGIPRADDYIEYDIYGEPIYSGIYFSRLGQKDWSKKITREDLPKEIWEGTFTITQDMKFLLSGAQKKIFDNGTFIYENE